MLTYAFTYELSRELEFTSKPVGCRLSSGNTPLSLSLSVMLFPRLGERSMSLALQHHPACLARRNFNEIPRHIRNFTTQPYDLSVVNPSCDTTGRANRI